MSQESKDWDAAGGSQPRLLVDLGPATGAHGARGIGRYVRGLAGAIALLPADLLERIWAVGHPGPGLDRFGRHAVPHRAASAWHSLPPWLSGRMQLAAAVRSANPAVFHATDPQKPWIGSSVPTIVTVYDLIPLREPEVLASWRFDHRWMYRTYLRMVASADRVVVISKTTARDVMDRLEVPSERIDIVPPVVMAPGLGRREAPAEPTFLFVGAHDPHKRPELALQAFARYRDGFGHGRLRYVGPLDAGQERRIRMAIEELALGDSVEVAGRISDESLEHAYGNATALVSTSRIEGFGLPPVEALLRGVPVIAVETDAAREILLGAATLVEDDIDAIADAMARPVPPPETAIAALRERFGVATVARDLEAVYRRFLG